MRTIRLSIVMVMGLITLFNMSKAWSKEVTQPDNSAQNVRDKDGRSLTPVDQSQNFEDIRISGEIRKRLMDDGTLSSDAKNAKVITVNGMVTLRGPVNSLMEKNAIETHVRHIVPGRTVNNLLEVKTNATV